MRTLRLIAVVLFALAACGRSSTPTPTPSPEEPGIVVVLAVDATAPVDPALMEQTRDILKNRAAFLGVVDPRVTVDGTRLRAELRGVIDTEQALAALHEQGLLELIDTGDQPLEDGTVVMTTFPVLESQGARTHTIEPGSGESPVPAQAVTITSTQVITNQVFATVLTGDPYVKTAMSRMGATGEPSVAFELTSDGAKILGDYTARNVGKYLTIVLDKRVISSPVIQSAIPDGKGEISGNFTMAEANRLAVQLRYGPLPLKLTVESVRAVP